MSENNLNSFVIAPFILYFNTSTAGYNRIIKRYI